MAVGNARAEHDGFAVLAMCHPLGHHVAHDGHAAFFGGLVRPLPGLGDSSASHIRAHARQRAHGHQHTAFCQLMHGGGVDQPGEHLPQSASERGSRQANHYGLGGLSKLHPSGMHGVRLVHDQHVKLWPEPALGDGLGAGNLKEQARIPARVVCLNDAVLIQAHGHSSGAGLVDQRGSVGQEHRTFAA